MKFMNPKISGKIFQIQTHTKLECYKTNLKKQIACLSESINISAESFAHIFFMKTIFKLP